MESGVGGSDGLRQRRPGRKQGDPNNGGGGVNNVAVTTNRPSLASLAEERARKHEADRRILVGGDDHGFSGGGGSSRVGSGTGGSIGGGRSPHWSYEAMHSILPENKQHHQQQGGSNRSDMSSSKGGSSGGRCRSSLSADDITSILDASTSAQQSKARGRGSKTRRNLGLVDYSFRLFSALSLLLWITLITIVYTIVPPENFEYMDGMERKAPLIAFATLTVSTLSWILPLLLRQGTRRALSGVMLGGITVQLIALLTELMFVMLLVPVMNDPITGVRVHLLRWCEWTPLAFLMTYLTEGTDVPKKSAGMDGWKAVKVPLLHGACQGLSTLCGLIFPFCRGIIDWSFWMVLSCILFAVIYFRLAYKIKMFRGMEKGTTVDDIETYARGRLSLGLLWTCTVMWSILVVSYFFYSFAPMFVNEDSLFKHSALTMVSEAFLDVLLKVVYMKIIVNVHDSVFDDAARAERRLKELREMMSVVWDSSSDVIVVSVRGARGSITTMISPTYRSIFSNKQKKNNDSVKEKDNGGEEVDGESKNQKGLVFEFDPRDYQANSRSAMPSSLQVHDLEFTGLPSAKSQDASDVLKTDGLSSLAELVFRAWNVSAKRGLAAATDSGGGSRSAKRRNSNESASGQSDGSLNEDTVIISDSLDSADIAGRWEAKITRLGDSALVMVLRDTSERSRRFEAEKRYVFESTARMKDLEANRFTRHEVKNGLLSAIGLCDSFADSLQKIMELQKGPDSAAAAAAAATKTMQAADQDESSLVIDVPEDAPVIDPSTSVCLHELDRTLNEVLHMVLADAMAREILHDVYEPRNEAADVVDALSSHHHLRGFKAAAERFPIIVRPDPLPRIICDLQLLTHIHRSAISNACKYGKKGGQVLTEVHFEQDDGSDSAGMLEMKISNLPGPHHDTLLELGALAEDLAFTKGRALNNLLAQRGVQWNYSSGNSAWIVQKSAHKLGGICKLRFKPERTEFSLRFPTKAVKENGEEVADSSAPKEKFRIPENTWGIAIDDSKIQRKLMERFLQYAGIRKDRCIVLGKDTDEIQGFVDFVVDFLDQHSEEHIFIVADENLDVVLDDAHHSSVSGSLCIESIRKRLLPGQEMRLLALVRSANDSSNDIAVYNSRAHGFLPKAPLQRDKVLDMIAPLWSKRYPRSMAKRAFYAQKSEDRKSTTDLSAYESEVITSSSELMQSIRSIEDAITGLDEEELAKRWGLLWEKLHALKGDMLTFDAGEGVRQVVYQINALRGPSLPLSFVERWAKIRVLAESALESGSEE